MRSARRGLVLFSAAFAVLAAVLALVLPAGIASAAAGSAAETRVWAFFSAAPVHVRADRLVPADQRLADPVSCPFCASGACVAPEGSSTTIYRSMRAEADGLPKIDASARGLGARPGVNGGDIPISGDGMVGPGTGGMSVSPDSPMNLPGFRRPPEFGGTGKDPVFCMQACDLPQGLRYRPDPANPTGHGFIEPAYDMPFSAYQDLIAGTRNLWSMVTNG